MNPEPLTSPSPEREKQKEVLNDNARKFVAEPLDPVFLEAHGAIPYLLVTDWTETGEDNETKVVYKKFDSGEVQIFLISKTTVDGKRTKEKEDITEDEKRYKKLKNLSKCHVKKMRHEFSYIQNGISFIINYDEFAGGKLVMLDVDGSTPEERDLFEPGNFPVKLIEVSDDPRYSGHRIAEIL